MPEPGFNVDIVFKPPIDTLFPPNMAEDARGELETTMRAATQLVRGSVVQKTPHAFGTLRNSIQPHTIRSGSTITGRVSTSCPYAQPVELGSRPHWAPIGPLMLWVQRKLGGVGGSLHFESKMAAAALRKSGIRGVQLKDVKQGTIEDVARRIQYSIAKHGTRARLMFTKGFDETGPTVVAMFQRAVDHLLDKWKRNA